MNTRIALSGLSIMASLALMAGATFALFSDTASSQDNTFSTGNANLVIAKDNPNPSGTPMPQVYGDQIDAPAITETEVIPNFSKDYFFWLKNTSTSPTTFSLSALLNDVQTTGTAAIKDELKVKIDCGGGFTAALAVSAWSSQGLGTTLAPNAETRCTMNVALGNVDNTFQSSSVRFDGVFTGTQTP